MAHLKKSKLEVKAIENCLAHALVIAVARVTNDADYKGYRQGRIILPRFVSCCRCQASILVEEVESRNYRHFSVIYRSID
jgi:hypothetical protein